MASQTSLRSRFRRSALRAPYVWWRHRGLRESDVFLASYPKSGNTWVKFMLGELLSGRELDFDSAELFMPSVGLHRSAPTSLPGAGRLLKTHERYRDDYRRVLYLVRDGRDVAISYYYHQMRRGVFTGSLDEFFDRFRDGQADPYGGWAGQVRSWLDSPLAGTDRFCLIRYEDLRADPLATMRRITDWLKSGSSDEDLARVIASNSAERMRAKESSSRRDLNPANADIAVVRKGRPGEWRDALEPAKVAAFTRDAADVLGRLGYAER